MLHINGQALHFLQGLPEELFGIIICSAQMMIPLVWAVSFALVFTPAREWTMGRRAALTLSLCWIFSSVTNIFIYFWLK